MLRKQKELFDTPNRVMPALERKLAPSLYPNVTVAHSHTPATYSSASALLQG